MSDSRMRDLLRLSYTYRWNGTPTHRIQTVAEHSYRVAVIARHLAAYTGAVVDSVHWALDHDGPECYTGDIPWPASQKIAGRRVAENDLCPWYDKSLYSPTAFVVVKMADKIEELMFWNEAPGLWNNPRVAWARYSASKILADLMERAEHSIGVSLRPVIMDVLGFSVPLPEAIEPRT